MEYNDWKAGINFAKEIISLDVEEFQIHEA
jgi:hypothetical protein